MDYYNNNNNNNNNSHTRVTYKKNPGFLDRVAGGFAGIFIGIALIIGANVLLFYNEGNAVEASRALEEGLSICMSVDPMSFSSSNNGRLIHFSGPLTSAEVLSDPEFNIDVKAVKLNRVVEMYQWVESASTATYKAGDATREEVTYSYRLEWRSDRVRSEEFDDPIKYRNPQLPISPSFFEARDVNVGKYLLSPSLTRQLNNWRPLLLQFKDLEHIKTQIHGKLPYVQDGMLYYTYSTVPSIGDVRVSFRIAGSTEGDDVSVIARQNNHNLLPYMTKNGRSLELLQPGIHSAASMFQSEMDRNSLQTWILRFVGWILLLIGFSAATSLLNVLVDWIPIVRNIVGTGVFLVNLILSSSIAIFVIALGWIRYRPLIGVALLALAIVLPYLFGKARKPAQSNSYNYNVNTPFSFDDRQKKF